MNAHTFPPAAAAPTLTANAETAAAGGLGSPQRYAHAFLSGEHDPRPAIEFQPLFTDDDWRSAAYCALDGDATDLFWMHAREEAYQAFQDWQRNDYDRREFEDFGNWLTRLGNRHLYRDALTAQERKIAFSDAELLKLAKGQRKGRDWL